ncbi:unnamed protein product [Closterium sp. NIES-53]
MRRTSASASSTSAAAASASATPPATATAASTSTAATEAPTSTTTPTPTPSFASTATTAAPPTSSSSLAPLALADAALLTRSRRSADRLGANKVDSSSRGNKGQKRNGGAPLKERSMGVTTRGAYSGDTSLCCKEALLEEVDSEGELSRKRSAVASVTSAEVRNESTAASALVIERVAYAAACPLDYATSLVAESASVSVCPPSVGGEFALGTDVLEDREEEFECFAASIPHLVSMLIAPEGDRDAPDIPTPRSYTEAIEGPYPSQWQAAMDAKMASWKSTGTYVDEVPPPGANIVSGMWIFRVKRPPGSPPAFKARYVAHGFSQRQGVDFFQTFSPTPKMTTLRVLLHVAAQRDYELHSLDFSTAFLQGSLHEEIWLLYGLCEAPREWHDTLRTNLAALGFAPSTSDPSLFLRTDTSLPPFYVLEYVDDLVFAKADTEALAHVKAQCTITLTQSHMVQQILQRFGFTYSSPQSTPLPTGHSLSAPPSEESVEPSGSYPKLVGCLMYLMTCTRPDLAYPLSLLARYLAPGRHRKVHWDAAKRVL